MAEVWVSTEVGEYKAGEYIRGLAKLEAQERDRCANSQPRPVAAGLAERMVRQREQLGELIAACVAGLLDDLGLNDQQKELAKVSVPKRLEALVG